MRYTYFSLHFIRGLAADDADPTACVLDDASAGTRAILTSSPHRECAPLDVSRAIAGMFLSGRLGRQVEASGTLDERIAAQVDRLREERTKRFGKATYLVITAVGDLPIDPQRTKDCGNFCIALDASPSGMIREQRRPLVANLLAAVALGLTSVCGVEQVADATVATTEDGKPLYCFNAAICRAELTVSSRVTLAEIEMTQALASKLKSDEVLGTIVRLLNESLEPNQDRLRRFLAAWAGLEVFVNRPRKIQSVN